MSTANEAEANDLSIVQTEMKTLLEQDDELTAFVQAELIEINEQVLDSTATIETIEEIDLNQPEEIENQVIIEQASEVISQQQFKPNRKLAIINSEEFTVDSTVFLVIKSIAEQFDGTVCLAGKRNNLATDLIKENVEFYDLDVTNKENITLFASYVTDNFGGVDILINNYNLSDVNSASDVIDLNYRSVLNLFNALFPLLRSNARVVNVSSRKGLLRKCNDRALRSKISSIETLDDLNSLVDDYIKSYQENTIDDIGYPGSAFDMSKLAINILTKIQQKNFDDSNNETPGLIVNSVCPGETGLKNSFLILKLLFLIIIF